MACLSKRYYHGGFKSNTLHMRPDRREVSTVGNPSSKGRRAALQLEALEPRHLMADTRPNFVFINTDDQRADTLQYMQQTLAELVNSGTLFENSFVTTALCCPSRASMLTGEYAHNTGVLRNAGPEGGFESFDDRSTLATWLNNAGYETALFGKYLNGYDLSAPQNNNPQNTYVPPGWDEWHAMLGASFNSPKISDNGVAHQYQGAYSTDLLANMAVDFIQAAEANDDQPFFVYYAPHAPHTPAIPAARDKGTFANLKPARPPSFNEADVSDKPNWVKNLGPLSAQEIADIDRTRINQIESLQAVDDAVGALMDTLRANGELGRTVVIFASDNGFMWGEHRYAFKGNAYEESIRVPLVIRDGRNPVARTTDEFALNIDIAPTIAAMAGIAIPGSVDGRSLAPLVRGQAVDWRTDFLVEHWSGEKPGEHAAVRNQRYTYVEYKTGERELYDLANDPFQLRNIASNPANAGLVSQLSARLAQLKGSSGTPSQTFVYFSTTAGGSLAGSASPAISFTDADILQLTIDAGGAYRYSLHFDGSDVGLGVAGEDIDAFDMQPDGSIVVSTVGAYSVRASYNASGVGSGATIAGGGEDLLKFTPGRLGSITAGSWSRFLDGSARGLTGLAENIDAVSVLPDGRIVVSTAGAASVPGVAAAADEDLIVLNRNTNQWSLYFDGSDVGLAAESEDIDAVYLENAGAARPTLFFSTRGPLAVPGVTGQNEDMVRFNPSALGANTAGGFVSPLAFDGSRFGLANFDIDGYSRGKAAKLATAAVAAVATPPTVDEPSAATAQLLSAIGIAAPPPPAGDDLGAPAQLVATGEASEALKPAAKAIDASSQIFDALARRSVSHRTATVLAAHLPLEALELALAGWELDD